MKTLRRYIVRVGLTAGFGLCLSASAQAQGTLSSRDMSVDTAFFADQRSGGYLPATGSGVPAGGALSVPMAPTPQGEGWGGLPPASVRGLMTADKADRKGRVYRVQGEAKRLKAKSSAWQPIHAGEVIGEGDVLLTGPSGEVSITFDARYLNVVHLTPMTRAEFRFIEPTDIHLSDGTLYNILDGLPKGTEWKVTAPAAVAAVRGTLYMVHYLASNGQYIEATLNIPDDGISSQVTVEQGDASAVVPEGNQLDLHHGEAPDPSKIGLLDPKWFEAIRQVLEDLARRRASGGGPLPPTAGELLGMGPTDPPDFPDLDPGLDTGALGGDPVVPSASDSGLRSDDDCEYECNGFDQD